MKNIIMYSTDWCGDCVRSEALLKSLKINFDVVDVDKDEVANSYIQELQNGARRIPTIVFPDDTFLVEPTDIELRDKLKDLGTI
jgi:glutaredoxin|tara:strand:- start:3287 stop:3538 length:252 start_codon:yes stop_codon:yes gene_type:complete